MGELYVYRDASHLHFTLNRNDEGICPEPYFSPQARTSILGIIHADHPDCDMYD